jgi:hypothetical protein
MALRDPARSRVNQSPVTAAMDSWSLSIQADDGLEFALSALLHDGLKVPPFVHHGPGSRVLRRAGLTAQMWRSWVEEIGRAKVAGLDAMKDEASSAQVEEILNTTDPFVAMRTISDNDEVLTALLDVPPVTRPRLDWATMLDPQRLDPADVSALLFARKAKELKRSSAFIAVATYSTFVMMRLGPLAFLVGAVPGELTWDAIRSELSRI